MANDPILTLENEKINVVSPSVIRSITRRVKQHRLQSLLYAGATLASIALCLVLFAGADKFSDHVIDRIFMPESERVAKQKLRDAESELVSALSELAAPLSQVIREVPIEIKPVLKDFLGKFYEKLTGKPYRVEEYNSKPSPIQNKLNSDIDSSPPPLSYPPSSYYRPAPHPEVASKALDQTMIEKKEILEILNKNIDILKSISPSLLIEIAEMQSGASKYVAEQQLEMQRYISDGQNDAQKYVSDSELSKIQAKEDGDTDRVRLLSDTITTGITRVGSLFLLVWIVRIFNAGRQRNSCLAEFYQGIGDYISTRDMCPELKLSDLIPPKSSGREPGDDLFLLATELIKARQ